MDAQLVVAVLLATGFAVTNGLHDASNAIATLVATRAATPLQAILLASVFNLLGPLLLGAAVADTIGGIVTVPPDVTVVFLFNPFNGRVFGGALAKVLRSLDAHPRPLRLIYVNPVEEEQVVATGRARLVRTVSGEGSPDEAPTSARICLYELR